MDEPTAPELDTDPAVDEFWNVARFHARLNGIPSYFGQTPLEVVQPPAWSFGGAGAEGDDLLDALLDGSRTTTETASSDFEDAGAPLPEAGTLGIVLDSTGRPRALVLTTAVEVTDELVTESLAVLYAAER